MSTSKQNVNNPEDPPMNVLEMDMKTIGKIKNVVKLREIADLVYAELNKVKLKGLSLKDEMQKITLQLRSTSHQCEQLEKDIHKLANVYAELDKPFQEKQLHGDNKLMYNEYKYECEFRNIRNAFLQRKSQAQYNFTSDMGDIINTRAKITGRLKILQKQWMKKLQEEQQFCKKSADTKEEAKQNEENTNEKEINNGEPKDREELHKIRESIRIQKTMWREFIRETQKDSYYKMTGFLESMKQDTFSKQQRTFKQQFKRIAQLREDIDIKNQIIKEFNEIPKVESNHENSTIPSTSIQYSMDEQKLQTSRHTISRDEPHYRSLLKKKELLLSKLDNREKRIKKLEKILSKLEEKNKSQGG